MTAARRLLTAPVLALVLALALLPGPVLAQEELVLGMSAAFSGPSQGLGIELYRGSMAYFEHVNRRGGVHGRRIAILTQDDGYNPTPAIENTIRFISLDKVLGLFGYVGTPTVTRVLPLIKQYADQDVLLFFPFTGAQPQREAPYDRFVFNLRASYIQETHELVHHLLRTGRSRIAVFYQADAYGRSGWDGVRRALAKTGLSIAAEATYHRGTGFEQGMRPQVEIIARARPEAVISVGSYAACAAFIRDARDMGLDVPVANLSFVGSENMLKLLADAGRGKGRDYTRNLINTQVVPSYEDLTLPAVREYRALMEEIAPPPPPCFSGGYTPLPHSFVSFEGFLNAKVMTRILELLGPAPSAQGLVAATHQLQSFDVGIDVPVSFGVGDHQGLNRVYFTTVREGKFIPLADWPETPR